MSNCYLDWQGVSFHHQRRERERERGEIVILFEGIYYHNKALACKISAQVSVKRRKSIEPVGKEDKWVFGMWSGALLKKWCIAVGLWFDVLQM